MKPNKAKLHINTETVIEEEDVPRAKGNANPISEIMDYAMNCELTADKAQINEKDQVEDHKDFITLKELIEEKQKR
jgi:hypothetical protein